MDIPLFLYQGYRIERPRRLYDYLLAAQGIVKRVENNYVSADHLLAPIDPELIGLGLAPYPIGPLRLKIPRIPGDCLLAALEDARSNLGLLVRRAGRTRAPDRELYQLYQSKSPRRGGRIAQPQHHAGLLFGHRRRR
jgi:hypothetical protein